MRVRIVGAVIAIVLILVALTAIWVVAGTKDDTWVRFATLLTAVASAVAAVAAWQSAARSDETARRAVEALGLSIQPDLRVESLRITEGTPSGTVRKRVFVITNRSRWPASDVTVEFDDGRGWRWKGRTPRVEGAQAGWESGIERPGEVRLEAPAEPIAPNEDITWPGRATGTQTTKVEYSDERGYLRWRVTQVIEWAVNRTDEGGSSSSGGRPVTIERVR